MNKEGMRYEADILRGIEVFSVSLLTSLSTFVSL